MFSKCIRIIYNNRSKYYKILVFRSAILTRPNFRTKNVLTLMTPIYLAGLWSFSKNDKNSQSDLTTRELLIAKADALFDQQHYSDIYDLLYIYKDSNDVEILWRICRALYNMSKTPEHASEAKNLIYEAHDLIMRAININENHWAVHKWVAILLNSKTSYEGTKIKIKELYNIKRHLLRASELNPKDATTLYMIGNWCYQVADLAWYQRKIASAIFGEPPTSSFEEALTYFEQAERIDPNFYSHNHLLLGKTYLKLHNKELAKIYLSKAAQYSARNDDDLQAKQEATKILDNLE